MSTLTFIFAEAAVAFLAIWVLVWIFTLQPQTSYPQCAKQREDWSNAIVMLLLLIFCPPLAFLIAIGWGIGTLVYRLFKS